MGQPTDPNLNPNQPFGGVPQQPSPYQQPQYGQPQQPQYGQPSTGQQQPPYGQPQQPQYGQPSTGQQQPPYGQPQQPQYSQPSTGQQQPQYGQPHQFGGFAQPTTPVLHGSPLTKPPKSSSAVILGAIAAGVVVLGGIGAGLWYVTSNPAEDRAERLLRDTELETGDCLITMDYDENNFLTAVPCADSHYWEVYAEHTVESDTFPGESQVQTDADLFCQEEATTVLGEEVDDLSTLEVSYLYPTQETWDAGDREYTCTVTTADNSPMTGSFTDGDVRFN